MQVYRCERLLVNYRSAVDVGRPLIKVVTPRNIAHDLTWQFNDENFNRVSLMWVGTCIKYFNDFSSSRLLIAVAENNKVAVLQHMLTEACA